MRRRFGPFVACALSLSILLPSQANATLSRPWECGNSSEKLYTVRVSIERGLNITVHDFAYRVMGVLCNSHSWYASRKIHYRYSSRGSYVVKLLTPASTEKRCYQLTGLSVHYYYSCASRAAKEAVLNSDRWFHGSSHWPGNTTYYRDLLVNHEFGHVLGQHHRYCPHSGAPAPVMQQQSKGLNGCTANWWPLSYEIRSLSP